MFNVNRRTFIKLTALLPAGLILDLSDKTSIKISKHIHSDLIKIYELWKQNTDINPEDYLYQHPLYLSEETSIKAMNIYDFEHQNTLNWDGMVVSKTEIAYLALIGKKVVV